MDRIVEEGGEKPRWHFDTFFASLRTVFQVLTDEKWSEVCGQVTSVWTRSHGICFCVLICCSA